MYDIKLIKTPSNQNRMKLQNSIKIILCYKSIYKYQMVGLPKWTTNTVIAHFTYWLTKEILYILYQYEAINLWEWHNFIMHRSIDNVKDWYKCLHWQTYESVKPSFSGRLCIDPIKKKVSVIYRLFRTGKTSVFEWKTN